VLTIFHQKLRVVYPEKIGGQKNCTHLVGFWRNIKYLWNETSCRQLGKSVGNDKTSLQSPKL